MPFHDLIGTYTQQDVEVDKVFADVAAYNTLTVLSDKVRELI